MATFEAQQVNILVGGPDQLRPANWQTLPGDWIGVDRGAYDLLRAGITPKLAVGDFDSLNTNERAWLKAQLAPKDVQQVPSQKDDTDTELAFAALLEAPAIQVINLISATGGRLDHLLSNMWLAGQSRFKPLAEKIRIIDQGNHVRYFLPGQHQVTAEAGMRYIGFMSLNGVTNFNIRQAKYGLPAYSAQMPYMFASNEFVGQPIEITFDQGMIMAVQSRDLN